MKKIIIVVVIIGMLGYATYEFVSSDDEVDEADEEETNEDNGIEQGDPAPDFELETLDGESASLSEYEGERVVVNFWATWCPPCRAEIPDLKKLNENHDVTILAVNMTNSEENEEKVSDFADEFAMDFPVLKDRDGDVALDYEVAAYPTSYYIDSDGHVQHVALGAMNYDQMAQELEKFD